jgi:hypothetical protein
MVSYAAAIDCTFDTDVDRLIRKLGLAAPDSQEDDKVLLPKYAKMNGAQAERYRHGILLRRETPRERHADLGPRDPVKILAAGDRARMPELVPVRYPVSGPKQTDTRD